ncbi:Aste57867_18395 [Aphanomyces stellatus]|uniref:Aste57867_18395 protein n=1 Tax=Aphanomyces stellatus TaxID=120398 RepID=A0A485LAB2_9STRA|nr:hypothetical protein As57867_018333 [Aphanomyces stellatus]VFT95131.1 Aste57867_18395 [Aphanomyces stellatus]
MPSKSLRRGGSSGNSNGDRPPRSKGGDANDTSKGANGATPTSSPTQRPTSPVLSHRSSRDREKLLQVPAASLTPLARPALGIRVLPSSLVDAANLFSFGDIYLSDLSCLRQFEIVNLQSCPVRVDLKADIRKPFHASSWGFQTHNENLTDDDAAAGGNASLGEDSFGRSVSKSSMTSSTTDTTFMDEGFNELFNQMGLIDSLVLQANQAQRIIFSICVKFDSAPHGSSSSGFSAHRQTSDDSSDEERSHLHEASFVALSGRLLFSTTLMKDSGPAASPDGTIAVPLTGNVCRSLLSLEQKELHFDDCVPGGSYVKDVTVWNRSEIPLIFRLVTSVTAHEKQLLTCVDYNTGYALGETPYSIAAYGHMRIRVTYRPLEVGEQFFEVLVQNLHDSRNVKTLKIHAIASKEHHREGLSIRDSNGSYLMGGSVLDFGDCYTGIPTSKVLVVKNMTEVALQIELLSDRPKEVTFELKQAPNSRARSSRSRIGFGLDEPLSPNEGERRLSLSPPPSPTKSNASSSHTSHPLLNGLLSHQSSTASVQQSDGGGNLDSDDEPDEQDVDFPTEDDLPRKRGSFEDQLTSEVEDMDDDMEFDGDKAALSSPLPPSSPKDEGPLVKSSVPRTRSKRHMRVHTRIKDLSESGVESSGASVCSSPERTKKKGRLSKGSLETDHVSNFLVEAVDLPPGGERTVLVWYCPPLKASADESFDLKACRLTKQSFRLNFRCYTIDGAWTGGATQRTYDRSLGKSLHVGARTCTSYVTLTPSTLHLGDCNIGEFKSSACTLTNHSELPTVVKPSVVSKVISTVPNDAITLGPKQSIEVKIEIIPRKINPNYSRVVTVLNLKNKTNVAQVCVRSSNMDAHHVIYHSLFYRLVTPSKSAFLNFDHVAANSMSLKMFMLENITQAVLRLRIQSSDLSRVQLYCLADNYTLKASTTPTTALVSPPSLTNLPASAQVLRPHGAPKKPPVLRRRRSIGCVAELAPKPRASTSSSRLAELLMKRNKSHKLTVLSVDGGDGPAPAPSPSVLGSSLQIVKKEPPPDATSSSMLMSSSISSSALVGLSAYTPPPGDVPVSTTNPSDTNEVVALFENLHFRYDKEEEMVAMVRERVRRFHQLVQEKQLVPISTATEWNIRIPPKGVFPVVAVFTPKMGDVVAEDKSRVEKYKVFITLPAGGNKPYGRQTTQHEAYVHHPFDTRPSVRELLLKGRVCRSVLNVNQKNINFGRITTFSKSSKKVLIHNGSAIPLIYMVEKTGSISSGFLEIKDGAQGVIKPFGTRQVHFEFQPTLAGPFEEKLKIVNVQDMDNSVFITIKAKVVKRETFKLPQAGQPINVGTCLVGEKSEVFKVTIRNMSRKKREYVIEVDVAAGFSVPSLRPTFQFSMDDIPAANITQAQEKKLDEELEKLEHKLRIAVTKKKEEKIDKLNSKISHVKALLSGEETAPLKGSGSASYDSGNSDTESETESKHATKRGARRSLTSTTLVMQLNQLHFTLEPEATGRIVGEVIFHQLSDVPITMPKPSIRHRGKRRASKSTPTGNAAVPIYGTGKFLFYEQQNKDVMKELQYKADVFLRTPAGEAAYCHITKKTLLPPVPLAKHSKADAAQLSVELKSDPAGGTRGGATLLIPVEEAPCDAHGWTVHLRTRNEPQLVDVRWEPVSVLQDLVMLTAQLADQEASTPLPLSLTLEPETTTTIHFKWAFKATTNHASSAPLVRALPPAIQHKTTADLSGGALQFQSATTGASHALDVVVVKAKPRSLHVDSDRIDLGELQLGTQAQSHFYIRNVSKHAIKFLVLVSSEDPSQLVITNATGRIDAGGTTMIRFSYTGLVSGKRSEHILVRNLSEKLDFTTLTVLVRVTRPVYVRIPELDPHMTGQLTDLNIGPCYVTQQSIDESSGSHESSKFAKIRKLTFVSQVAETLLLSASSNLRTQCYVYQDAALTHDATNIVLPGMESLDLYIAFRPRLPADAFKTGATRDLFGGIRIQLLRGDDERTDDRPPPLVSTNPNLVAEFTVKFVGVAGASLATVGSRLLDFGTEINTSRLMRCKTHEGTFDVTNMSKALPLRYRLIVTQGDDYSDDDSSLHVALRHEKGEIPPGETAEIAFRVMAYTHGYFRRRIVVENVLNPMNVNFVDVALFVYNGTVSVEYPPVDDNDGLSLQPYGGGDGVNLGLVPLLASDALLGAAVDTTRRYRIFQPPTTRRAHTVLVTNRSPAPIRLRPLSNLPLLFAWNNAPADDADDNRGSFAHTIDGHDARELRGSLTAPPATDRPNQHVLYVGDVGQCPPQTTIELTVVFASLASSSYLPIDAMEAGRAIPVEGFVALQSFEQWHDEAEATTLAMVPLRGTYGESKLAVSTPTLSLGKLGYGQLCKFNVDIKNLADLSTVFQVGPLPACFRLLSVSPATAAHTLSWATESTPPPPLTVLAQRQCPSTYYSIDGLDTATLEMECLPECLTAGKHDLSFRVFNLHNPTNVDSISATVHVIAKYIDVSLESNCLDPSKPMETSVGYFTPMVVPPPADGVAAGFVCTLVNVFDEELDFTLQCSTLDKFEGLVDLVIVSRTANTPVTALTLAPGERVDVRITCRLVPGTSWTQLPYASSTTRRFDDAVSLGVVSILAFSAGVALSCAERIEVNGSFVLGQSFTVSTTHLEVAATAIVGRQHFYALAGDERTTFVIHNPSPSQPLPFGIESIPLMCPGQRFLQQDTTTTVLGDALVAKCLPDHGSIPPGESIQILVVLEETTAKASDDASSAMQLIVRDNDQSFSTISLALVLNDAMPVEIDAHVVDQGLAARLPPLPPPLRPTLHANSAPPLSSTSLSTDVSSHPAPASPPSSPSSTLPSDAAAAALPVITLRGCTPAENSTLENALYVIDVGQHTVRSGGDVEWEISLHVDKEVDYRLYLADPKAKAWLHLSKTQGTVVSFQTIVLRFVRDVVGVYSTFVVLENGANPTDLKLIRVKLEVIADLNALRAMSKSSTDHLFRVWVSCYSSSKRARRKSSEDLIADVGAANGKLEIEYGDVFYDKLYHNHSLVLENFSSLSLDFMLSSNGRAHEVGFSMSPNSFNEISSVTLGAYARLQVFLNFRPAPRSQLPEAPTTSWVRNIEVYINCRLVKDFRETVCLKAICNYPQMHLHIALNQPTPGNAASYNEPASPYFPSQPTFLGMGFTAPESVLLEDGGQIDAKFLVMKNARRDANAHVAIRNDSMFFDVAIDHVVRAAEDDAVVSGAALATTGSPGHTLVRLEPHDVCVVRIRPNLELLRKNRTQWEHAVKEHIAFYNMKQFAEHYHVSLSFTPSNTSSFYVPPQLREAYPFSTLEDTIAKFLRHYNLFWTTLLEALGGHGGHSGATMLYDLENAIDHAMPSSPTHRAAAANSFAAAAVVVRDTHTFAQAFRALYFDFYYITDELIWYGIRSSAGRHAITLADLVYGVVFGHDVFGPIFNRLRVTASPTTLLIANQRLDLRRLLLPWTRQLGYFLSFFPETQEATLALRNMYEPLKDFDLHR